MRCLARGGEFVRAVDHIQLQRHKLARERGEPVHLSFRQPALDHDAAAHVSEPAATVLKGFEV